MFGSESGKTFNFLNEKDNVLLKTFIFILQLLRSLFISWFKLNLHCTYVCIVNYFELSIMFYCSDDFEDMATTFNKTVIVSSSWTPFWWIYMWFLVISIGLTILSFSPVIGHYLSKSGGGFGRFYFFILNYFRVYILQPLS